MSAVMTSRSIPSRGRKYSLFRVAGAGCWGVPVLLGGAARCLSLRFMVAVLCLAEKG